MFGLSKGLLEKRLEDESYEYYIPETPDKVRVVRIEEISKMVEEMRKEMPIIGWKAGISHTLSKEECEELRKWFVRWLGGSKVN